MMKEYDIPEAEHERRWRNVKRWTLFFEVIFLAILALIVLATWRH